MNFIIRGTPASRGLAHGSVKVVREWTVGLTLQRGTVLVTRFPLTTLTPLLDQAVALVCGYGGMLSALVTIAREYRLPVVMGLGDAIEQLSDGDEVWVDGMSGIVSSFNPRGAWWVSVQDMVRLSPANEDVLLTAAD